MSFKSVSTKKAILAASMSAAILAAPHAIAATQGTLGATSSGDSIVTISKLSHVQVSAIDDIDLGTHSVLPTGTSATGTDDICVFSSNTSYRITFDQVGGAFALVGANTGDTIAYSVNFTGLGVPAAAAPGTAITGQLGNPLDPSCLGVSNAGYTVSVAAADFNAASADSYSAVLELLVEPE